MNKKLSILIPVSILLLTGCVGTKSYESSAYLTKPVNWVNEEFRILELCDIHFSHSDYLPLHYEVLQKTIDQANADLIVLNGDVFTFADKSVVKSLFSFIDNQNIPWTFTFGNHDDQGLYSDVYIQRLLAKDTYKNVRFINLEDDNVTGRSNFVIPIYKDNELAYQVFLLDSHSYNYDSDMYYDYVKQDQIDWYKRMIDETSNGVKSSLYMHIPLPEFRDMLQIETPVEEQTYPTGSNEEIVAAPYYNSGLYDAIKEKGLTQAVCAAHDHVNNFVCEYIDEENNPTGIYFSYGLKATDRVYFSKEKIGGQVLKIKASGEFDSSNFENIYVENDYKEGR